MSYVRILIDGFSLLHGWPELASRRERHTSGARTELVRVLTTYQDSVQTPVTVIFDGSTTGSRSRKPEIDPGASIEVLYARRDQTADQLIERAAVRLREYGEVLVVTNDSAEHETVTASGAHVVGCGTFILMVKEALSDLERECLRVRRHGDAAFRNRAG